MTNDGTGHDPVADRTTDEDPATVQFEIEKLRSEQNLLGGLLAGLAASAIGAGVWASVTVATGYQIGWMALGVGFLVGYAVRIAGKGIDTVFGITGAALALLGCGAGNLLAISSMAGTQQNVPLLDVLSALDLTTAQQLMAAGFSPVDLLFYGIAVYEGFQLSFRRH